MTIVPDAAARSTVPAVFGVPVAPDRPTPRLSQPLVPHTTVPYPAAQHADTPSTGIRLGILGPLRITAGGRELDPGPRKQQIVLAALACHANTPVSVDALVEALWPSQPPQTPRKNIQVYVSTLRSLFGRDGPAISHHMAGYVLHVSDDELDLLSVEHRARLGRDLRGGGRPAAARRVLADALTLWRGPVLAGLRDVPMLGGAARRLEQRLLGALEDWAEAELAAGGGAAVIERVAEAAHRHPVRERLRTLQMTALCQAGRRSEALAVYDEVRRRLAREFGLAPSPAIEAFYRGLLRESDLVTSAHPEPHASATSARRRSPATLLPRDLPTFTGRRNCISRLVEALAVDGERVAVVSGTVGAGKTALAIHVAHQLAGDFPDGRLFVRLRDADGAVRPTEEVLAELLWAVEAPTPESPGAWAGDVRILWRHWWATHRALLVVDDVSCESELRPFLPDVGQGSLIATARCRLPGLEPAYRLRLGSFTEAEALEFLVRVLGPVRVSADSAAASRIAAAAGHTPLVLRAAAERLAWLGHLPLAEYAVRLERGEALMDEVAAATAPIRSRLAGAVAALPEPARSAFVGLGTLDRRFHLDEAAAMWEIGVEAAARLLEALLDNSMVAVPEVETRAASVVYETPALVHAYAREVAAEVPGAGAVG